MLPVAYWGLARDLICNEAVVILLISKKKAIGARAPHWLRTLTCVVVARKDFPRFQRWICCHSLLEICFNNLFLYQIYYQSIIESIIQIFYLWKLRYIQKCINNISFSYYLKLSRKLHLSEYDRFIKIICYINPTIKHKYNSRFIKKKRPLSLPSISS